MKLGLGLGPGALNNENLQMAKQLGCSHIVAWMPFGVGRGTWEFAEMLNLRKFVESYDLQLAAFENFQPSHWDKILLGQPGRERQMENLKITIRNMGKAGIPIMGYYFSLAGVWGHWRKGQSGGGRGNAGLISFDAEYVKDAPEIPLGEVWGRQVDENAPVGTLGKVSEAEMWERYQYFLENLVPVAEESGVKLAAHQDDPPVPELRGTHRLFISPSNLQKALDLVPSPNHGLEFCQGTVTEMGCNVYDAIRQFAGQKKIFYVHFRNVRGAVPRFDEAFIDEGDVDMLAALRAYQESGFDGVMIPDHTPRVTAKDPWATGMAYALGYMKALFRVLGVE